MNRLCRLGCCWQFGIEDFHVVNGVLATANSIMKRFRWVVKSDPLLQELLYCLNIIQVDIWAGTLSRDSEWAYAH